VQYITCKPGKLLWTHNFTIN